MNKEVIEKLGTVLPPSVETVLNFSSSIALNSFGGTRGSVYALCEDGHVRSIDLDNTAEDKEMVKMELDGVESLIDMDFSGLDFNFAGTILLLSGSRSLAVAFLPERAEKTSPHCKFMMLYHANATKDEIAKVMWHPLSDKHIVVLLKTNKLLMFDVLEGTESEYLLDTSKRYTSFCFGPSIDWMSLSIFILDSTADVTCMCPILPTGSVVPTSTIQQLHDWLSDPFVEGLNLNYLANVNMFLRAAFGGGSASEPGTSHLCRSGIYNGKPLSPGHQLHDSFYRQPLLQGPLVIEGRLKKRIKGKLSSDAVPCDICMPPMSKEHDPIAIVLITWSDGVVEQFVVDDSFGPSWEDVSKISSGDGVEEEKSLCIGSPNLIHVETLCITSEISGDAARNSFFSIICDPLETSNFHITSRFGAETYLLHLEWISQLNSSDTDKKALITLPESVARLIFKHPLPQQCISGHVLISDALFGHITIVRCDDGYSTALNLSVEEKMMLLDSQIQTKNHHVSVQSTGDHGNIGSIIRSLDIVLAKARAALNSIPVVNYSDEEATSSKYGEELKHCIIYLSKEVVDPLEEFQFGMKFINESLRESFENQYVLLHGTKATDNTNSSSSASLVLKPETDDVGLIKQYEIAKKRHEDLKLKLDKLGNKISQQKDVAASSLHFVKRKRVGLTRAEELYKVQVDRWYTAHQHLEVTLDRLREQVDTEVTGSGTAEEIFSEKNVSSARKSKHFMTPTKPRTHVASPHRISYNNSPISAKSSRVKSVSSNGSAKKSSIPPKRYIMLDDEEQNSCHQLQKETGNLHDALKQKLKSIEERLAELSSYAV